MAQFNYGSPGVRTFETDKSDYKSIWRKTTNRGSGGSNGNGEFIKSTPYIPPTPPTPTPLNDFLTQEDGFYLLQENNDKIIL